MSPFSVKWVYELDQDYSINVAKQLGAALTAPCAFLDRSGRRWLELRPDGTLKVLAPYAWDGCTPKFAVLDIVIGTPDGIPNSTTRKPKAYFASLVHDALYQFMDAGLPLSRQQADHIFLDILARDAFAPRWIYFAAVRAFGELSRRITRRKRTYSGRRIEL